MVLPRGVAGMVELKRYRSIVADSARWEGFRFREGDIVISTPAKCGTTWMQTLCALLIFDTAELDEPLAKISPWLDMQLADRAEVVARLEAQSHRRLIKTHTPLDGVPFDERATYVSVGRDPRDVAVSSRHHMDNMDIDRFLAVRESAVGLEDLAELDLTPPAAPEDRLREWMDSSGDGGPMSLAATVNHLRTFWERRDDANVELFHYADLLADLQGQLRRLADALAIEVSDQRISELAAEASFAAMKGRAERVAPNADVGIWRSTTEFFHRGSSGQWREVFHEDDLRHYEERVAELAPPDLATWLHEGWLGAAAVPAQPGGAGNGNTDAGSTPTLRARL